MDRQNTKAVATLADIIESYTRLLSVSELTGLLGVSDETVYRMVREGQIPYVRVRGTIKFDPKALADWLRSVMFDPEKRSA
jgi:excisionase family DNA binding protein